MRGPEESSSSDGGRDLREDILNIPLPRSDIKQLDGWQMTKHLLNSSNTQHDQELDADLRSRVLA